MRCSITICSIFTVVFSLLFAFTANAKSYQSPQSRNGQDKVEKSYPLGLDDPLLLEFAGVKQAQIEKIEEVRKKWKTELAELSKEKANRKTIGKAYGRRRMSCEAILDKDQIKLCRRYDLFTNEGPRELVVLKRSIEVGEPEFDAEQLAAFQKISKSWLQFAEENFKFNPTEPYDKAQRDKSVAAIAKVSGEYEESLRRDLFQVLSESQKERFEQIELQSLVNSSGVRAFAGKDVADVLKLTATQKSALQEMLSAIDTETVKYIAVTLQFDGYKKFFDSLSDDQQNIWRAKLGKPFSVSNRSWFHEFMKADQKSVEQQQN